MFNLSVTLQRLAALGLSPEEALARGLLAQSEARIARGRINTNADLANYYRESARANDRMERAMRDNPDLDAVFGAPPLLPVKPSGPLRTNSLLDDAFGLTPARWQGEPEKPKPVVEPPKPVTPQPVTPVVQAPVAPKPPSEPVQFWTPPPEDRQPLLPPVTRVQRPRRSPLVIELTELEPVVAQPILEAVGVRAADALPREYPGEELLYRDGQWFHRCPHCGPVETVIVPGVPGRQNPVRQTRSLFTTPLARPLQHQAGCPRR